MVATETIHMKAVAGTLAIGDLGDPAEHAQLVASLADDPLLVPVLAVLAEQFGSASRAPSDRDASVISAMVQATLSTTSPAALRDSLDLLIESSTVLGHAGDVLVAGLLQRAEVPATGSSLLDVLAASESLECATRLVVGGFGSKFKLWAVLESLAPGQPAVYQRVAVRCAVVCIEHDPGAESLTRNLQALAGLTQPAEGQLPVRLDDSIESDIAVALARVSILLALRAPDTATTVEHLDDGARFVSAVIEHDDRVDAVAVNAVASLLRSLAAGEPMSIGDVDALETAVREHRHFASGLDHWATNRNVATNVEWSRMANDLRQAASDFTQPSWYETAPVVDRLADLYRTSRSERLYMRAGDGKAVQAIIAPSLEGGFAAKASLLHQLELHVMALEQKAADGTASNEQIADLPIATELRDEARAGAYEVPAKPVAGAAEHLSGASEPLADMDTGRDRVLRSIVAQQLIQRGTTGSIVGDDIVNTITDGFSACPDFSGDVRGAAETVAWVLTCFLMSRDRLGKAEVPYLFETTAIEEDLARDLQEFIPLSGQLGGVRSEVRQVAGGRVDIEFGFPGFNFYVELKVDSTAAPLADKAAYLRQTAAYQTQGTRLGFLVVLKHLPKLTVPPLLIDCIEMVSVSDGTDEDRVIAAFTVAGSRRAPSDQ